MLGNHIAGFHSIIVIEIVSHVKGHWFDPSLYILILIFFSSDIAIHPSNTLKLLVGVSLFPGGAYSNVLD